MDKSNIDILLVEDRLEDAELIKMALRANNLKGNVCWVRDGQQALDYFESPSPSDFKNLKLVLLDVNIPKISGLEVLDRLKTPANKHIPVVMLSTSKHQSDLEIAYDHHANSYILKPVKYDDFVELVAQIGHYWIDMNVSGD